MRPLVRLNAEKGIAIKNKIFLASLFFLGLAVGFFLDHLDLINPRKFSAPFFELERLYPNGEHLINPLMLVEGPPGGDAGLESVKQSLESYLRQSLQNKPARVAVYVRNLNKGRWVGINENEKFTAASLAKIRSDSRPR